MTKSLQNTETITCDECGKSVTRDCGEPYFGGNPFGGWYHLKRYRGSIQLEELHADRDWDFCSIACLHDWTDAGGPRNAKSSDTCQHEWDIGISTCARCGAEFDSVEGGFRNADKG